MSLISRLFYKSTNLMPKKEIIRTCKSIGTELGQECKLGDNIDLNKFKQLLTKAIGEKNAKKIVIADDFDTFCKYTKSLGLDDNLSEMYFMGSKSAVLMNPKDKTILLSLRTADANTAEALNIASHELEHVLFRAISPRALLDKLIVKVRGQNYLNKFVEKYGQLLNEKNIELQQNLLYSSQMENFNAIGGYTNHLLNREGLLKQTGFNSYNTLREYLDSVIKNLLDKKDNKTNIKILKALRVVLKDESRAYKTGGAVERMWSEANGTVNSNATKSEMLAMLYDETLPSIKKELKKQRIQRLKNIFKFKSNPQNTENI